MSLESFSFTYEETEEGYTVTLKGDKEKLKSRLEAFEAFLNFREKAQKAGWEHPGEASPMHHFMRAMHKHHEAFHGHEGHHGPYGHPGHHGHHGQDGNQKQEGSD